MKIILSDYYSKREIEKIFSFYFYLFFRKICIFRKKTKL